jgi:hypothetical protein
MKRVFTQTVSARYKVGQIRDWPMPTWNGIAESLKMALDKFTNPLTDSTFVAVEEGSSVPTKRNAGRSEKD